MKFKVSTSNYFPNLYNYYYFIEAIKRKYQSLGRQFLLEDNSDIEQTAKKKKYRSRVHREWSYIVIKHVLFNSFKTNIIIDQI